VILNLNRNNFYKVFTLQIFIYLFLFLMVSSMGFLLIIDIFIFFILLRILKYELIRITVLSFFLFFFLLVVNIFYSKNITDDNNFFNRGHEKYYNDKNIYAKNISDKFKMSHGDINAIDVCSDKVNLKRQQQVQIFKTDKYGFRNDNFTLEEADVILVGDSFIAGTGNTQRDIPANILSEISDLKVAAITVISNPLKYEEYLKKFLPIIKKNAKIFVFYFQGNDFNINLSSFNEVNKQSYKFKIISLYERLERNKDSLFIKKLRIVYHKNYFFKKIRPKSQRFLKKIAYTLRGQCPAAYYHALNETFMGFYYKNESEGLNVSTHIINDKNIINRIEKIVFVPSKFSVYQEILGLKKNNRYGSLEYLKTGYKKKGIEVLDLTNILRVSAQKKAKEGKLVYWSDDTHWNEHGIRSGMKYLLSFIKN